MEEPVKFQGTCTLEDKEAREWLSQLNKKIENINERTKSHTRDIQDLRRTIKELSDFRRNTHQ